MKKIAALLLALLCLVTIATGCKKNEENPLENTKLPLNDTTEKDYDIPKEAILEYDINFDEYITLPDYKNFELEYDTMVNNEKAIDDQIFNLQLMNSTRTDLTDKAAEEGDVAIVSYTAVYYGTDEKFADQKNVEIVLGRGIHIPGLEDAIVGMNVGETKTADIVYPPDSRYKALASTKTTFTITLNKLQSAEYPELTPENIIKFNLGANVNSEESLREFVKQWIDEQNLLYKQNAIYEKLMDEAEFLAMPSVEFKHYQDLFEANFEARAKASGITVENLIQNEYGTADAYELARDTEAQENVCADLVMYALKAEYGVEVTREEYNFALNSFFESGAGADVGIDNVAEFHEKMGTSVYKNELLMQVLDAVEADVKDAGEE